MILLNVRSPYFIQVNESGQLGSKIELFIWNDNIAEPATPTYVLSKSIASVTQTNNVYNISNFIKGFIENTYPDDASTNFMYVNVKVKRYKEAPINTYTLLDTISYIGVYGYTLYLNGFNNSVTADTILLANKSITTQYSRLNIPYINVISDIAFDAVYKDLNGANTETVNYTGGKFYKVPLSTVTSTYDAGNTLTIGLNVFKALPIEEPKYTPIECSFINRFGGWQIVTFFKAQTNLINITNTNYNVYSDVVDYSIYQGQSKVFNSNGTQNIRLNTGFVPENYSELIQDLLLSEKVLLDSKPVTVTSKSTDLKTSIKDRNINYEVEFTFAFDLINSSI
jgi:hypothetical protein